MTNRMKSGNNTSQTKRDPYQLLLRITVILVAVVVVSVVVFLLCNSAVQSDYQAKRQQIDQLNTDGEQEFVAKMDVLRASNSTTVNPDTGEVTAVESAYWEKTLDNVVWRLEDESQTPLENTRTETVERASLLSGGLILVNPCPRGPPSLPPCGSPVEP